MKPYPKYKDSGVEWIGEVPEHWEVKRLKYVTAINPSKENSKISKDSDELVTFLPMEKVNEDGTFATDLKRPINELWNGFTYFEELDIIFAKITPCFENGKGAYLINLGSRVGFGSTEFHVLREIANTSVSKYLYYITRFDLFRKTGESLMIGVAGQKRVSSTFAENFLIGIPPVLEQQSITAYLDRKTTQIDKLISKKQKLIELLKEERAAIINQAVTKGLNPDAPMKDSGIEWLGKVPAHWEVKRLKYFFRLITEKNCSLQTKKVALENIESWTGRFIDSEVDYQGEGISFLKGDVLFGKLRPYLAKVLNAKFSGASVGDIFVMRPKLGISSRFAFYRFLSKPFIDIVNGSTFGAKMPRVSWDFIANLHIAMPNNKEQRTISGYLDSKTIKIDQTITNIKNQIDLLQEYRTALISEVVTGKIDVRT